MYDVNGGWSDSTTYTNILGAFIALVGVGVPLGGAAGLTASALSALGAKAFVDMAIKVIGPQVAIYYSATMLIIATSFLAGGSVTNYFGGATVFGTDVTLYSVWGP